mmetsp:Transcript_32992/g.45241  ORF Transcript_32992/g.45241 Transcript_32992/m.45241 type:complete len:545 (+) Transcript_32992:388-2022(+)
MESIEESNNILDNQNMGTINQNNSSSINDSSVTSYSEINSTSLSLRRPKKSSIISYFQPFQNFTLKGICFTVSKSIVEWSTVGLGVKVPVTANFPIYDSLEYLPRIGLFVGFFYPNNALKFNISVSLPVQVILYIIIRMLVISLQERKMYKAAAHSDSSDMNGSIEDSSFRDVAANNLTNPNPDISFNAILPLNHSSSNTSMISSSTAALISAVRMQQEEEELFVYAAEALIKTLTAMRNRMQSESASRRAGFTLSYKLDPAVMVIRRSCGAWLQLFLPFSASPLSSSSSSLSSITSVFFRRLFLPLLLCLPAAVLAALSLLATFSRACVKKLVNDKANELSQGKKKKKRKKSTASGDESVETGRRVGILGICRAYAASYSYWRKTVSDWAASKSTGFGFNVGVTRSPAVSFISDLLHNMSPMPLTYAQLLTCSDMMCDPDQLPMSSSASMAMASSVQFDIQPFYPLQDLWNSVWARRTSVSNISNTTNATTTAEMRALPDNTISLGSNAPRFIRLESVGYDYAENMPLTPTEILEEPALLNSH